MEFKAFFKDMGESITNAADKAGAKVDNAIELSKIKRKISLKKKEISTLFEEVGKTVLNESFDASSLDEVIRINSEKVYKILEEIDKLEEERRNKEGKFLCHNCSKEVDINMKFCPDCGAKLKEDRE